MFLLELIEEQVPYHNIEEDEKVVEYIQGGGRIKKQNFSRKTNLQKKLYEIIKKGNGLFKFFKIFNGLYTNYCCNSDKHSHLL